MVANDTIEVTARRPVPGVFAKLFGLDSVTVRAHPKAPAAPGQARWAAPFAVDVMHPAGLDKCVPLDWYYSDPGSKFNSGLVRQALDDRIGTDLLFPIYRHVRAEGAGFDYEVIGWVGWHLTGDSIGGKGKLFGSFTRFIWDGIQSEDATADDFGVRSVSLVD